jgi:hypothetical protein
MIRISVFVFMMGLLLGFHISVSLSKYHLMVHQVLNKYYNHGYQEQMLNVVIFEFFD